MTSVLRTSSIHSSEELGNETAIVLVEVYSGQVKHVLHKKLLMDHCTFFHDWYSTRKQIPRVWCIPVGTGIALAGVDHTTFSLVEDFLYDGHVPDLTVTSDEPLDLTNAVNVCCLAIDLGAHELANRIMDQLQCYHFHHVGTSSAHFTLNQIKDILKKTTANTQIWNYCIASIVCRIEWESYEDGWGEELMALYSQFPVAEKSIDQLKSTYKQDTSPNNADYRVPAKGTLFTPCYFHDHKDGKPCHTGDTEEADNQDSNQTTKAEKSQSQEPNEQREEVLSVAKQDTQINYSNQVNDLKKYARTCDEFARVAKKIRNSALAHLTWAENEEKLAKQRVQMGVVDISEAIARIGEIRKRALGQYKLAESKFKSAEKEAALAWNIIMKQTVAQKSTPIETTDRSETRSDDVVNNDSDLPARTLKAQEEMYQARILLQRSQAQYEEAKKKFSKGGSEKGGGVRSKADEVQVNFAREQLENATLFVEHAEKGLSAVMDETKRAAGIIGKIKPEKKKGKPRQNRSSATNNAFKHGGETRQGTKQKQKQKGNKSKPKSKP